MMKSSVELSGNNLNANTLHIYLKDPTFVEYLNSFLLLPAFSNQLFYNEHTCHFEQVYDNVNVAWMGGNATPSSSVATLYIQDDTIGPSVEKKQSWQWVIQHRLPLFLRSDLYSEFKICKLLTSPADSKPARKVLRNEDFPSPNKQDFENNEQQSDVLPEIGVSRSHETILHSHISNSYSHEYITPLSDTNTADIKPTAVTCSKSDAELESKLNPRSRQRVKWHRMSASPRPDISVAAERSKSLENTSIASLRGKHVLMSDDDIQFLSTKSGMTALWKFLRGKAGEKNWLFWLDVERVKYYSKSIDQQRLIRELRERYLHSGSPLELPAEIRVKLNMSKSTWLSLEQIEELQKAMIIRLRKYWCPRFLLHYRKKDNISSSSSRALTPLRSYSTPMALSDFMHTAYTPATTPLPNTPTHTPTFKRLQKIRPESSMELCNLQPPQGNYPDDVIDNKGLLQLSSSQEQCVDSPEIYRSASADCVHEPPLSPSPATDNYPRATRKVWSKSVTSLGDERDCLTPGESGSPRPNTSQGELYRKSWKRPSSGQITRSSAGRYSQLAKYTNHHFPDSNSRCASRLEGSDQESICRDDCRILSISGTPLHSTTLSPRTLSRDIYEPMLKCLVMEHRKAGGYFMHYLEKLDNSVYINCLLFWREVQEYKSLFVQASFSACAVEKKAKGLFGRHVCEGSTESIECSGDIINLVSDNLWPAYEDLFDQAEEHALDKLLTQWIELSYSEDETFKKLDTVQVQTHYVMESPIIIGKSPSRSTTASYFSTDGAGSASGAVTLDDIINNAVELERFKVFLNENCAAEDLMCWMDIEAFRGIPASDKSIRSFKAKELKKKYLNKEYYFGPNSPASKEAQLHTVQAGGGSYGSRLPARPRTPVFRETQKHVRGRLEKKWLAMFIISPEFLERNRGVIIAGTSRSNNCFRSQSFYHHEEAFTNSREAILFRKFLQSKEQRINFLHYLSIKASSGVSSFLHLSYPKQDIEFWCEVQKYKGMFHAHTTESVLQSKVAAITDCYFRSSAPPELQIDVPMPLAHQVTQKPPGPYLFRETQATIFKKLHGGWKEYNNFSGGLNERKIEKALDKFEKEVREHQKVEKLQREVHKQADERKRSMFPRFETTVEKELRIKHEKEMKEFGPIGLAFRLSVPDPSYTYYTDLPGSSYVKSTYLKIKEESTRHGQQSISRSYNKGIAGTKKRKEEYDHSSSTSEEEEDVSICEMTLEGRVKTIRRRRVHVKSSPSPSSDSVFRSEEKTDSVSRTIFSRDVSCSTSCDPGRKPRRTSHATTINTSIGRGVTTLKMHLSEAVEGEGEACLYGNGLPEEQSSFLAITSQS